MNKVQMVAEIQSAMERLRPVLRAARAAGNDDLATALLRQIDGLWRVAAAIHNDMPVRNFERRA